MSIPSILRRRAVVVTLLVGLPLSFALLWLAARGADVNAVADVLARADVGLVLPAALAMGCVFFGSGVRWRAIARTPDVSTARFVEMVVSGIAVNDVVPGRLGELLRARWLGVAARIPGGKALATVVVDRIFDVVTLVLFLVLALPFVTSPTWLARIAIGGFVILALVGAVLVAARLYTRYRPHDGQVHRNLVRRLVRDTLEGLAEPLGRRREAALLALSVAIWAVWALSAWLAARSIGIELSLLQALFVTAVVNLGVAIPSSPGFIGTYQWLVVSALALFSVGPSEALAFAILLHAIWYVPTLVVGGALLVRRGVLAVRVTPATRLRTVEASDA